MEAKIYTDGSALGNPGPGGFCALVFHEGGKQILKGGEAYTTNNRMEMSAVIAGLHWVHEQFGSSAKIKLYSDSNLIIQTVLQSWKKKMNLDLWEKIDLLRTKLPSIEWHWIKGHAGHKENTEADKVATGEAAKWKRRGSEW